VLRIIGGCLCSTALAVSFLPFEALWIVEGLVLLLGAPLRIRDSPAARVREHELGIVDGLLATTAICVLAVFVVFVVFPVGFPWGLAPEASRVGDAREYLVKECIVGPAADAAGRKEGRRRRTRS